MWSVLSFNSRLNNGRLRISPHQINGELMRYGRFLACPTLCAGQSVTVFTVVFATTNQLIESLSHAADSIPYPS